MELATNYCVKFTVLDALKFGYTVAIIQDRYTDVNFNKEYKQYYF